MFIRTLRHKTEANMFGTNVFGRVRKPTELILKSFAPFFRLSICVCINKTTPE
jgi:hypothetical protein